MSLSLMFLSLESAIAANIAPLNFLFPEINVQKKCPFTGEEGKGCEPNFNGDRWSQVGPQNAAAPKVMDSAYDDTSKLDSAWTMEVADEYLLRPFFTGSAGKGLRCTDGQVAPSTINGLLTSKFQALVREVDLEGSSLKQLETQINGAIKATTRSLGRAAPEAAAEVELQLMKKIRETFNAKAYLVDIYTSESAGELRASYPALKGCFNNNADTRAIRGIFVTQYEWSSSLDSTTIVHLAVTAAMQTNPSLAQVRASLTLDLTKIVEKHQTIIGRTLDAVFYPIWVDRVFSG